MSATKRMIEKTYQEDLNSERINQQAEQIASMYWDQIIHFPVAGSAVETKPEERERINIKFRNSFKK